MLLVWVCVGEAQRVQVTYFLSGKCGVRIRAREMASAISFFAVADPFLQLQSLGTCSNFYALSHKVFLVYKLS